MSHYPMVETLRRNARGLMFENSSTDLVRDALAEIASAIARTLIDLREPMAPSERQAARARLNRLSRALGEYGMRARKEV